MSEDEIKELIATIILPQLRQQQDAISAFYAKHYSGKWAKPNADDIPLTILSEYQNDVASTIPCQRCGGKCIEFAIPNDIWNAIIRTEGHERDDEYICIECFFDALRKFIQDKK